MAVEQIAFNMEEQNRCSAATPTQARSGVALPSN
jgi:hypothetical protein